MTDETPAVIKNYIKEKDMLEERSIEEDQAIRKGVYDALESFKDEEGNRRKHFEDKDKQREAVKVFFKTAGSEAAKFYGQDNIANDLNSEDKAIADAAYSKAKQLAYDFCGVGVSDIMKPLKDEGKNLNTLRFQGGLAQTELRGYKERVRKGDLRYLLTENDAEAIVKYTKTEDLVDASKLKEEADLEHLLRTFEDNRGVTPKDVSGKVFAKELDRSA